MAHLYTIFSLNDFKQFSLFLNLRRKLGVIDFELFYFVEPERYRKCRHVMCTYMPRMLFALIM